MIKCQWDIFIRCNFFLHLGFSRLLIFGGGVICVHNARMQIFFIVEKRIVTMKIENDASESYTFIFFAGCLKK